jgi:hypothetical protein
MKPLIACYIAVSLFACKPSKDTPAASSTATGTTSALVSEAKENTTASVPDSVDSAKMRFIVSFYSIGTGAEQTLAAKFKVFAVEYLKTDNKKIKFDEVRWGREGESDFCLSLKELTPSQQVDFISKSKELLKEAKYVHYYENKECLKRK